MGVPSYTISNSTGIHSEEHSRRSYIPFSAEASLASRNVVIYDCGDDKKHVNDFFRPYIQAYNDAQKRKDRKKFYVDDYCAAIESGEACYGSGDQKEHIFHHEVLQIGNRDDLGVTDDSFNVDFWRELKREGRYDEAADYVAAHLNKDPNRELAKEILIEALQEIKSECRPGGKYSNVLLHGIVIHDDEVSGTCHADLRYSIFTDDEKQGLPCRLSDHKGLIKMGFETDRTTTALQKFRESINEIVEEKMREKGFERKYLNEHRRHLSTAQYEAMQRIKEAEDKADDIIRFAKESAQQIVDSADMEVARLGIARDQFQEKKLELIDAAASVETLKKSVSDFLKSDVGKRAYQEYLEQDLMEKTFVEDHERVPEISQRKSDDKHDAVQQEDVSSVRVEMKIPEGLDAMQAVRYAQQHMNDDLESEVSIPLKKKKKVIARRFQYTSERTQIDLADKDKKLPDSASFSK